MQPCAGSTSTDDEYPEESEASEPNDESRRSAARAWPAAPGDAGAFSMAELRAKAESLKASANMATLRASANKTGQQCVTSSSCIIAPEQCFPHASVIKSLLLHRPDLAMMRYHWTI